MFFLRARVLAYFGQYRALGGGLFFRRMARSDLKNRPFSEIAPSVTTITARGRAGSMVRHAI